MKDQASQPICSRCGFVPPGHRGTLPLCDRCKVENRLDRLGLDPAGPLRQALVKVAERQASSVLKWLSRSRGTAPELVTAVERGEVALTHDSLNAWPRLDPAERLRSYLIAGGVLPDTDRELLRLEGWLYRRLVALADHPHERILRRFALWYQMPRLRQEASRAPLRSTAGLYATRQLKAALGFVTWADDQQLALGSIRQADLDAWAATHRVHDRHNLHGFLTWATASGVLRHDLTMPRQKFKVGPAIAQQRRLTLLNRYLTDETLPLRIRCGACLLLLYGQPVSRVHRLTRQDLLDVDGELFVRFGTPATPVPEPLAALLRQLASALPDSQWLFPGRLPELPISHRGLHIQLRQHGFPVQEARVAALRQLVLQAPAPVIADALGIHHTTATRQAVHAGSTWSQYAGGDHSKSL